MCCSTEKLLKIFSVVFFSCKVLPDAVFSLHGVFGGVAGGGGCSDWLGFFTLLTFTGITDRLVLEDGLMLKLRFHRARYS